MNIVTIILSAAALSSLLVATASSQQAQYSAGNSKLQAAPDEAASPIFGVSIPRGYRQWEFVASAHEAGLDELRGILGNALAMNAYKQGTLPFPDGAILAKLAWKHVPSPEIEGAFVPGSATTVQIMVKDSKRYASTGGWGFGRFVNGKPVDEAQHQTCFACHQGHVKNHDLVFTRLAP